MNGVVVFGGYGVFGGHVCRELARRGIGVAVAGRDPGKAAALAASLGPGHEATGADATDAISCRQALRGRAVAVHCAGPFDSRHTTLLDACLELGCHYVDIADDRRYAAVVRSQAESFRRRGLSAVYGCSSVPGLSGALSLAALRGASSPPLRVRVTLLIGNDNPKGLAAVQSLVQGLGRPITAPQGTLHGFCERAVVPLPPPFGRRAVFSFDSPEYDLFPSLLGVRSVTVHVGFELRAVTYGLTLLALCGPGYGERMARFLSRMGGATRGQGTSGAALLTELFFANGSCRRASLCAAADGQRMAALPAALAAETLVHGRGRPGSWTAYELLGADQLLGAEVAAGFRVSVAAASIRARQ